MELIIMKVGCKLVCRSFLKCICHVSMFSVRVWLGVFQLDTVAWITAAVGAPLEDRGEQNVVFFSEPLVSVLSVLPQALKWHLSPLTIVSWLNVYLQVAYLNDIYEVLLPQYPQQIFIQIAEASGPRPLGRLLCQWAQLLRKGCVLLPVSVFFPSP